MGSLKEIELSSEQLKARAQDILEKFKGNLDAMVENKEITTAEKEALLRTGEEAVDLIEVGTLVPGRTTREVYVLPKSEKSAPTNVLTYLLRTTYNLSMNY